MRDVFSVFTPPHPTGKHPPSSRRPPFISEFPPIATQPDAKVQGTLRILPFLGADLPFQPPKCPPTPHDSLLLEFHTKDNGLSQETTSSDAKDLAAPFASRPFVTSFVSSFCYCSAFLHVRPRISPFPPPHKRKKNWSLLYALRPSP